jgi:hypothetical protein
MIRQFALVVLDNRDKVIDRFSLDLTTKPRGLGFYLEINTIITDIEEIPVEVRQKLKSITCDVHYAFGKEYLKARMLRLWIEKNTNKRMALEWINEVDKLYIDGKVQEFEFSELTPANVLSIPLTFKPLSPFFEVVENAITILPASTGKIYPYKYPYKYGIGVISNNSITNNYIRPIPLIVTLYGEMVNAGVSIIEEGQTSPYAQVSFNLTLTADQYITINAVTRKITYFNGQIEVDGYNLLDLTKQSFIFARENTTSFLSASVASDQTGRMEASYRRYRL